MARAVADAVTAAPGVAGLHPGFGVEVATLYSGGKVVGVRLTGDAVEVYIRAQWVPLEPVADAAASAARTVLSAAGDDRPVTVVVADVADEALDRRQTADDRPFAGDRRQARGEAGAHG